MRARPISLPCIRRLHCWSGAVSRRSTVGSTASGLPTATSRSAPPPPSKSPRRWSCPGRRLSRSPRRGPGSRRSRHPTPTRDRPRRPRRPPRRLSRSRPSRSRGPRRAGAGGGCRGRGRPRARPGQDGDRSSRRRAGPSSSPDEPDWAPPRGRAGGSWSGWRWQRRPVPAARRGARNWHRWPNSGRCSGPPPEVNAQLRLSNSWGWRVRHPSSYA